ncbi:hypothetical protein LPLAFNJD_LOCUS2359 [Methylorubrum aminovorans]
MAEIIRFPNGGRVSATTIPRAEFERLAELALDVVDRIILLLDTPDQCDRRANEPHGGSPHSGASPPDP